MKYATGFFDVDCRELNETGDQWQISSRMVPVAASLRRLYDCAERMQAPVVSTTCCSRRMLQQEAMPPGILYVPLDAARREWEAHVDAYRMFYLQKNAYGEPSKNLACRAFDTFHDNGNAARLVRMLNVQEWVVFGAALDICVDAAVQGLLTAGQRVCLLVDVTVPAAKGYGECGTQENARRVIANLVELGARVATLEQLEGSILP